MHITTDSARICVHQQGSGPDLLLLGGLGDPYEAWQAQLDEFGDRYRIIAPDNRGAGRSPLPAAGVSIAAMAEDAATVLHELGVERAHVAGFSMGGAIAQELAIAHPELVRSLVLCSSYCRADAYFRAMVGSRIAAASTATDDRELLASFFLWIYTARAHENGMADALIDETLESPLVQSPEAFLAAAEACIAHDTADRLGAVTAPTLLIAGAEDRACPPRYSQAIAERLPGAEVVVMPGEAHQPFQEAPTAFNALVEAFWRRVERAEELPAAA